MMRKLQCIQVRGLSVQEVLDEFNGRREEVGIESESDIVSVSVMAPTTMTQIARPDGGTTPAKVEVAIVYWDNHDATVQLSEGEKMLLAMLSDLNEHLKVKGETDPALVKAAVWGDKPWGLSWEYSWLFRGRNKTPENVKEAVNIMEMWSIIESYYNRLSPEDKELVKKETHPYGGKVQFPGFDGNDKVEGEYMGIAQFLVDDLHKFSNFKGRDFNSHHEMLDVYRRMLKAFASIRPQVPDTPISAPQIVSLLNERRN